MVFPFTKVLVPAVYKEWVESGPPDWVVNDEIRRSHNYSVFLYQKLNESEPNYISTNYGRENGVYFKYIVDHYHTFPDVAVFIHAKPQQHPPQWLDYVRCIAPNVTYSHLNLFDNLERDTEYFSLFQKRVWVENCMRDVLAVIWNKSIHEIETMLPIDSPIRVRTQASHSFVVSRSMIHRRSYETWKQLYAMLGNQQYYYHHHKNHHLR